jgi:phage baseplate assembly protein W
MATDFLGVGWRFPVAVTADGQIDRAGDEDAIADAIWLILSTAKGERAMRPDFGCGIHDLVFAVAGATTAGLAAQHVHEALVLWEPRIQVLDVTAAPAPGALHIRIEYRVRSTNNVFNLVYPFYLERGTR